MNFGRPFARAIGVAAAPLLAIAALVSFFAPGCVHPPSVESIDISTGAHVTRHWAPSPAYDFSGSFRSPQTGELQLIREGDEWRGRYAYTVCKCSVTGEIRGNSEGNLLRAEFSEYTSGCPNTGWRKGDAFLYAPSAPGDSPYLYGRRVDWVDKVGFRGASIVVRQDAGAWTMLRVSQIGPPDSAAHCP